MNQNDIKWNPTFLFLWPGEKQAAMQSVSPITLTRISPGMLLLVVFFQLVLSSSMLATINNITGEIISGNLMKSFLVSMTGASCDTGGTNGKIMEEAIERKQRTFSKRTTKDFGKIGGGEMSMLQQEAGATSDNTVPVVVGPTCV